MLLLQSGDLVVGIFTRIKHFRVYYSDHVCSLLVAFLPCKSYSVLRKTTRCINDTDEILWLILFLCIETITRRI